MLLVGKIIVQRRAGRHCATNFINFFYLVYVNFHYQRNNRGVTKTIFDGNYSGIDVVRNDLCIDLPMKIANENRSFL